ncbi:hypothetical protein MTO96_049673 [Rhipicephalus appendiculatus]
MAKQVALRRAQAAAESTGSQLITDDEDDADQLPANPVHIPPPSQWSSGDAMMPDPTSPFAHGTSAFAAVGMLEDLRKRRYVQEAIACPGQRSRCVRLLEARLEVQSLAIQESLQKQPAGPAVASALHMWTSVPCQPCSTQAAASLLAMPSLLSPGLPVSLPQAVPSDSFPEDRERRRSSSGDSSSDELLLDVDSEQEPAFKCSPGASHDGSRLCAAARNS